MLPATRIGGGDTTIDTKGLWVGELTGVSVAGELDMQTAPQLEDAVTRAVDRGGPVFVDLSAVTFMDSTGIHVLVRAARRLLGRGCVIVHGEQPQIARVLDVAALEQQFGNFHRVGESGFGGNGRP